VENNDVSVTEGADDGVWKSAPEMLQRIHKLMERKYPASLPGTDATAAAAAGPSTSSVKHTGSQSRNWDKIINTRPTNHSFIQVNLR